MITAAQKELFQHVCFGALMAGGIINKSPQYIAEKMKEKEHTNICLANATSQFKR